MVRCIPEAPSFAEGQNAEQSVWESLYELSLMTQSLLTPSRYGTAGLSMRLTSLYSGQGWAWPPSR